MRFLVIGLLIAKFLNIEAFVCTRMSRDSAFTHRSNPSDDKDEVSGKEAEFQAMLDGMLAESRKNIAKKGINMDSTEAMLSALEEAKKLNLTAEDEQKAVDEFSASFVDFVDSMVRTDDNKSGEEELTMMDQFAISNSAGDPVVDVGPIDNLSLADALKIIKNLDMSQQDYDETVELLNDVDPSEISDIIDFMLRARSKGQDKDM
jgi:hypothetical protein